MNPIFVVAALAVAGVLYFYKDALLGGKAPVANLQPPPLNLTAAVPASVSEPLDPFLAATREAKRRAEAFQEAKLAKDYEALLLGCTRNVTENVTPEAKANPQLNSTEPHAPK